MNSELTPNTQTPLKSTFEPTEPNFFAKAAIFQLYTQDAKVST